eukprot:c14351_g1_i3.p1 GENE.c14351_g1_i3~~c14351_g1_i3.p1  ORF type:complete len:443 (-),score=98.37 c14351_g1_i3:544-1872(-)
MTDTDKQASMNLLLGVFSPQTPSRSNLPRIQSESSMLSISRMLNKLTGPSQQQIADSRRVFLEKTRDSSQVLVWQIATEEDMTTLHTTLNPPLWDLESDFHLHNPDVDKRRLWQSHRSMAVIVRDMVNLVEEHRAIREWSVPEQELFSNVHNPTAEALVWTYGEDAAYASTLKTAHQWRMARQRQCSLALFHSQPGLTSFDAIMTEVFVPACLDTSTKRSARKTMSSRDSTDEQDENPRNFKRWFMFTKEKMQEHAGSAQPGPPPLPYIGRTSATRNQQPLFPVYRKDRDLYQRYVDYVANHLTPAQSAPPQLPPPESIACASLDLEKLASISYVIPPSQSVQESGSTASCLTSCLDRHSTHRPSATSKQLPEIESKELTEVAPVSKGWVSSIFRRSSRPAPLLETEDEEEEEVRVREAPNKTKAGHPRTDSVCGVSENNGK